MVMISVILPVYNAEKTLKQAVESIIGQNYTDWELIIINDGSSDNSKNILSLFVDERIRIYDNPGNKGLVYSLNRALSLAKGKYVARMDSDDISLPNRFVRQLEYLENKHLDLVGCMTKRIDSDGNVVLSLANKSYSPETIARCIRRDNCIAHPTWFGKKTIFEQLKGYRNFHACEDYDFLLRALKANFRLGIADSIQLLYRESPQGISFSNFYKQEISSIYLRNNYAHLNDISEEDLSEYLHSNLNVHAEHRYQNALLLFNTGLEKLRNRNPLGLCDIVFGIFTSKYILNRVFNIILIHYFRKVFK